MVIRFPLAPPAGLVHQKGAGGTFLQTVSDQVRKKQAQPAERSFLTRDSDGREAEVATTCNNLPAVAGGRFAFGLNDRILQAKPRISPSVPPSSELTVADD